MFLYAVLKPRRKLKEDEQKNKNSLKRSIKGINEV